MTLNNILRDACRRTVFTQFINTSPFCNCSRNVSNKSVSDVLKRHFRRPSVSPLGGDGKPAAFVVVGRLKYSTVNKPVPSESKSGKAEESREELLDRLSTSHLGSDKRLLEEPELAGPHVVYEGLLSSQMKRLKRFSLATSAMGLAMQPLIIEQSASHPMAANIAAFGIIGFFTYVTPLLIHNIAKKYVTELIYNPETDTYTAATYSFFLKRKELNFTIDEVKVPDVPGPFTSLHVTKDGKQIPLFLAPESFTKPAHYGRFMGYDKPIDLQLTVDDNSSLKGKKDT